MKLSFEDQAFNKSVPCRTDNFNVYIHTCTHTHGAFVYRLKSSQWRASFVTIGVRFNFKRGRLFFFFFLFLVVESAAVFLWKYISKRLGSIADKAKRRDEEEEDGVQLPSIPIDTRAGRATIQCWTIQTAPLPRNGNQPSEH